MENHKFNHHKDSIRTQDEGSKETLEGAEALALARQVIEGQEQPEQLSSLARIVMNTLNLTTEEAQQMANDLGFSRT